MKRNIGLARQLFMALIILSVVCGYQQSSHASPPAGIQIKYALPAQTLFVTITHDTMFKGSHFIKYIEIKKNGAIVSINKYESQPTGDTFTYTYKIPAIEEDTFQITATCSKNDSKISPLFTVK